MRPGDAHPSRLPHGSSNKHQVPGNRYSRQDYSRPVCGRRISGRFRLHGLPRVIVFGRVAGREAALAKVRNLVLAQNEAGEPIVSLDMATSECQSYCTLTFTVLDGVFAAVTISGTLPAYSARYRNGRLIQPGEARGSDRVDHWHSAHR